MLYDLLAGMSKDVTALNVFRYITFRTAGATVTALLFVFLLGPSMISLLRLRLRCAGGGDRQLRRRRGGCRGGIAGAGGAGNPG